MEALHDLKRMICKELNEIAEKGELSAGSLQTVDMLTHSLKSIVTVMAMEDSGYSRDEGGYSGRRDSMGRYADGSSYNDGYSGRRYSRDEGKTNMIHQLENLMSEASSPEEKEIMKQALNKMRNM